MKRSVIALVLLAALAACRSPGLQLPIAPADSFRRAEEAFIRHDYAAAAAEYRRFIDGKPDPAYLPRAYYQLAVAQYRQQLYSASLATLDELKQRDDRVGGQSVQTFALRGDVEVALGQRTSGVLAWENAWQVAKPVERPRIEERLVSVRDQLTDDERADLDQSIMVAAVREILGLRKSPGVASVRSPVAVAQATPAKATGTDDGAATSEPNEPSEVAPADSAAPAPMAAPELAAESEPVEPEPATKVACLLPLTGPDHAYGLRALAGLRLAFADTPQQLVVRDTGGEPSISTKLLQQLGDDPKVVAVIGPLRSSEAEVAAPLAEREQMPLLLLSQREGLTGRFVLQAAMTRSQQADLLVAYAVDTLKLHKFGVFYPDDGYGSAFAAAFKAAAAKHAAGVGGAQAYQAGRPNYGDLARTTQRWHQAGVDGVFIPDAAAAAIAIAAAVRGTVPEMALLGTESWNDAATLSSAGATINGAIFTDAFFVDSARPSTRQFVERFERGAGRPPSVFEAQAFDAGMVVRRALGTGATSRDEVIARLSGLGTFEGAGELRAAADGFQRALSLLRYRDGRVEEITD
ncbi:MAG TPA: ABC transporter substrate-binding protein [Candidatus Kryptonia bacterium]|nr:ABC transporter substrate-binding protein [Candidatus Kryptonia bacterium]